MPSGSEGVRRYSQGLRESEGSIRVSGSQWVQTWSELVRVSSQDLNESEGPVKV